MGEKSSFVAMGITVRSTYLSLLPHVGCNLASPYAPISNISVFYSQILMPPTYHNVDSPV